MQLGIAFIAGLIASASMAPVTHAGTFSIDLQRRADQSRELRVQKLAKVTNHINRKYAHALQNYQRNTGKSHPLQSSAGLQKRASGAVDLVDIKHEVEWAGQLAYGSPLQSIYVDFDTGSSDTLVNPGTYDPSKSKTSKKTSDKFEALYGDGTAANGTIYTDDFGIASAHGTDIAIGLSDIEYIFENERPNQGISGLAYPAIQAFPLKYKPFFTVLREQKAVDQGIFQFTLKPGNGSTLYIGGIDKSQFTGDIVWQDYKPELGFYVAPAYINGQKILSVVDSGTTLIQGPTSQVRKFLETLPGVTVKDIAGTLSGVYDCNKPPKITMTYAGKNFTLGEDQTNWGTYKGQCVLSVSGQDDMPLDAWVVGDVFFQMASVIFDQDNNRLGFATQANASANATSTPAASSAPIATSTTTKGSVVPAHSSSTTPKSSGSKTASTTITVPASSTSSKAKSSQAPTSTSPQVVTATVSGSKVTVTATQTTGGMHCGNDNVFGFGICISGSGNGQ
ncbi:aspartic-type endopeptidase [Malassezia pachydermatis]